MGEGAFQRDEGSQDGSEISLRARQRRVLRGEKKRAEVLQLEMLKPKFAILDETDSGLDVDALRVVSEG